MAKIYLTHEDVNGGNPVRILCNSITINGTNNTIETPESNGLDQVEVQTQSFENLRFTLNNVEFVSTSSLEDTILDWEGVKALYQAKYTGSNPAILNVNYGFGTNLTSLKGIGDSVDIRVVLKSHVFIIDAKDSKQGYKPTGTLTFLETK